MLFEDKCTKSHTCAGRVMGVLSHISRKPRNIMELVDKYRDANISYSGWRELDPEIWFAENIYISFLE